MQSTRSAYNPPLCLLSPHPHVFPFGHFTLFPACQFSPIFSCFQLLSLLQPFLPTAIPLPATGVLAPARLDPLFFSHLLLRNDGKEEEKMWRIRDEKKRERKGENVWDQHSPSPPVSTLPPSLPASLRSSTAASPYPINSQLLISLLYSPAFFYRAKYHQ